MKPLGSRNIGIISLLGYRFPLAAIASILHRISGVVLFLLIPFSLWILHLSLASQMSFLMVKDYLGSPVVAFLIWVMLSALFYHLIAGLKHLLMDMGCFEEKVSGKVASSLVLIIGIVGTIGIGVWMLC